MNANYGAYHRYLREEVIAPFYARRLASLQTMRLNDVLRRKNPYLFKAKNIELAGDLARSVVDAFLSSQEETLFGNLLEGFAVFVSATLDGGVKSARKSLDLEFRRDDSYYIVGIKSGTNWANADQISIMKANFKRAKEELRASGAQEPIIAVNGCIYGRDARPFKADADPDRAYYKYAGQAFWKFISGDDELYKEIIAPIDEEAKIKDETFRRAYNAKINELTADFSRNFLTENQIDWAKLVEYVSRREPIPLNGVSEGGEGVTQGSGE